MAAAAVLMAVNQWVHRRERKEFSIDTEMHGKPSLSARIETLMTKFDEREKSQELVHNAFDGIGKLFQGHLSANLLLEP